mmetsp:Transcript_48883/g.116405  ORF Transcript_48883/g.116405 Transcript_48883/m.116405 type:complete len:272 (-) Transcript_48883:22-837(-)
MTTHIKCPSNTFHARMVGMVSGTLYTDRRSSTCSQNTAPYPDAMYARRRYVVVCHSSFFASRGSRQGGLSEVRRGGMGETPASLRRTRPTAMTARPATESSPIDWNAPLSFGINWYGKFQEFLERTRRWNAYNVNMIPSCTSGWWRFQTQGGTNSGSQSGRASSPTAASSPPGDSAAPDSRTIVRLRNSPSSRNVRPGSSPRHPCPGRRSSAEARRGALLLPPSALAGHRAAPRASGRSPPIPPAPPCVNPSEIPRSVPVDRIRTQAVVLP